MYFSNSQASRDLPMPAIPIADTRCAFPSSADAWNSSLTRRSSRSRPTNGGSSPSARSAPPRGAGTGRAPRGARDGGGAPELLGLCLALQWVRLGVLVGDGSGRRAFRPVADEDG